MFCCQKLCKTPMSVLGKVRFLAGQTFNFHLFHNVLVVETISNLFSCGLNPNFDRLNLVIPCKAPVFILPLQGHSAASPARPNRGASPGPASVLSQKGQCHGSPWKSWFLLLNIGLYPQNFGIREDSGVEPGKTSIEQMNIM